MVGYNHNSGQHPYSVPSRRYHSRHERLYQRQHHNIKSVNSHRIPPPPPPCPPPSKCTCNTNILTRFVNDAVYTDVTETPTRFFKCSRQHIIGACCLTHHGKCKQHVNNGVCVPIVATQQCQYGCYVSNHIHQCVAHKQSLCDNRPNIQPIDLTVNDQIIVLCINTPYVTCRLQVHVVDAVVVGYIPLEYTSILLAPEMTITYTMDTGSVIGTVSLTATPNTFVKTWIPISAHIHIDPALCYYNAKILLTLLVEESTPDKDQWVTTDILHSPVEELLIVQQTINTNLSEVERILAEDYDDTDL